MTRFQPWRDGFFIVLLLLLAFNLVLLVVHWRYTTVYDLSPIIVALMLVFQHVAFYYTKTGRASVIMKTLAWTWTVLGLAYIVFIAPRSIT